MTLTALVVFQVSDASAQQSAVATAPAAKSDPNLNAVVWMQTSAEYAAVATQTYRTATHSMNLALDDLNWTAAFEQTNEFQELPPAVVLDLDETVLDNSKYQARQADKGASFTDESWRQWVKEAKAGAVPGAVSFLNAAVLKGVAPIYITNRVCEPSDANDPTVQVLKANRVPYAPDRLFCRTTGGDKSGRRKMVAERYRILLLIGDDFNDFTDALATQEKRAELQKLYEPLWGVKWFVLPNPAYGSWERAIGGTVEKKWEAMKR